MFEILFPALLTGLLLSLITAPLVPFVVWRKMAYFGDTLPLCLTRCGIRDFLQINPLCCHCDFDDYSRRINGVARK